MKKIVSFVLFIFILVVATLTYATDVPNNGYAFNLNYQGEIKKIVQKDATVAVITSKEFTVTVTDESQVIENVENANVENNVIEEIPQTLFLYFLQKLLQIYC